MFRSRIWNVSTLIATMAGLAGCTSNLVYEPHLVEKHSDAGAFTVAATMVDTWDNFVDELSPDFGVDEMKALELAIPRTGVSETQMLDALGLEVKVAPPTSATESTVTETLTAEGETETTGEETTTEGPGELGGAQPPSAPSSALNQQAATKLPPKAGETVEIDPFLKYTVATGLYQEVKLLNNAVRSAAQRHKMVPYILRLQMNNVPYARHQPYDTYAAISLFAREVCANPLESREDNCSGKRDPNWDTGWRDREAVVVPLLVTDNLESLFSSRTSDVVRQIATAASILQGGFAASLGLTRKTEELNAVLANDLNSLMTVGRAAPNSLYVRLGAMQEATARHAMVPRNYSVTLLVLVPEDGTLGRRVEIGDIEGIRITGSLSYRNAETGAELPRDPRNRIDEVVSTVVRELSGSEAAISRRRAELLLVSIYVNDYGWFNRLIEGDTDRGEHPIHVDAPADLWNALLERAVSTGYFGASVDLPKPASPQYPGTQTVLLFDNGDKTQALLRGGQGLSAETLDASLTIPLAGGGTATIPAEDIRIGRHGGNPALVFPSLAAWGIKPRVAGEGSTHVRGARLELSFIEGGGYERTRQVPGGSGAYSDAHYRVVENAEKDGS